MSTTAPDASSFPVQSNSAYLHTKKEKTSRHKRVNSAIVTIAEKQAPHQAARTLPLRRPTAIAIPVKEPVKKLQEAVSQMEQTLDHPMNAPNSATSSDSGSDSQPHSPMSTTSEMDRIKRSESPTNSDSSEESHDTQPHSAMSTTSATNRRSESPTNSDSSEESHDTQPHSAMFTTSATNRRSESPTNSDSSNEEAHPPNFPDTFLDLMSLRRPPRRIDFRGVFHIAQSQPQSQVSPPSSPTLEDQLKSDAHKNQEPQSTSPRTDRVNSDASGYNSSEETQPTLPTSHSYEVASSASTESPRTSSAESDKVRSMSESSVSKPQDHALDFSLCEISEMNEINEFLGIGKKGDDLIATQKTVTDLQHLQEWQAKCSEAFSTDHSPLITTVKGRYVNLVKGRYTNLSSKEIAKEVWKKKENDIKDLIADAKASNLRVYDVIIELRNILSVELKNAGYEKNSDKKAADIVAHLIANCEVYESYKQCLIACAFRWGKCPKKAHVIMAKYAQDKGLIIDLAKHKYNYQIHDLQINQIRRALSEIGYSAPEFSNETEAAEILHQILKRDSTLKKWKFFNQCRRGLSYKQFKKLIKKDLEVSLINNKRVSKEILQGKYEEAIKAVLKIIEEQKKNPRAIGQDVLSTELDKLDEAAKTFFDKTTECLPAFVRYNTASAMAVHSEREKSLKLSPNNFLFQIEVQKSNCELMKLNDISNQLKFKPSKLTEEIATNNEAVFKEKNRIPALKRTLDLYNWEFNLRKFQLLQDIIFPKYKSKFDDSPDQQKSPSLRRMEARRERILQLVGLPLNKQLPSEQIAAIKEAQSNLRQMMYPNKLLVHCNEFIKHLLKLRKELMEHKDGKPIDGIKEYQQFEECMYKHYTEFRDVVAPLKNQAVQDAAKEKPTEEELLIKAKLNDIVYQNGEIKSLIVSSGHLAFYELPESIKNNKEKLRENPSEIRQKEIDEAEKDIQAILSKEKFMKHIDKMLKANITLAQTLTLYLPDNSNFGSKEEFKQERKLLKMEAKVLDLLLCNPGTRDENDINGKIFTLEQNEKRIAHIWEEQEKLELSLGEAFRNLLEQC